MKGNIDIRIYLLSQLNSVVEDISIIEKLDNLKILTIDGNIDLDTFYNEIPQIISWNVINNLQNKFISNHQIDDENKILNILMWAIKSWEQGIKERKLNKIIISYIFVEKLQLIPEIDLSWNLFDNNFIEWFGDYLSSLNYDIKFDPTDNLIYSDRKYYEDYIKSLQTNDYKGILHFLSALSRRNHQADDFVKIIVKIAVAINLELIAKYLNKYSPVFIRLILSQLDNIQIINVLTWYVADSPLPLLIGLIKVVNPSGNNVFDTTLLSNTCLLNKLSETIQKICLRVETTNLYSFITDCSNIFMNKLWHSIYSVYLAHNPQHFDDYINVLNFSYDTGENSFDSFAQFCDNSKLDSFSIKVYNQYFAYLVERYEYQQHLFCYTSYIKYLLQAAKALSNHSFSVYLDKLEEISNDLKRSIYSWESSNKYVMFSKWIYWLLSSKIFDHDSEIIKCKLKTTFDLLSDARITNVLNCQINEVQIRFDKLIDLLENPASINSFILPHNNSTVTITWPNA
jgi:hypothetical protein